MFLASGEYRKSFSQIFEDNTLPDEPSFYINASGRTDATVAPQGKDTLTILVPVGHQAEDGAPDQDWPALIARARQAVLARLRMDDVGIDDITEHLVYEKIYSPADWASRYNVAKGSTFGLNHNFCQVGYLRPQCKHPRYKNLFFAGSSCHPGSGLPNVLVSARLAANRIFEEAGMSPLPRNDPGLLNPRYAPIPDVGVPHGDAGWLEVSIGLIFIIFMVVAAVRLGICELLSSTPSTSLCGMIQTGVTTTLRVATARDDF
eukprot:SAG31_NODE_1198_length_9441_cov_3.648897_7_plen_261_part_00